MTAPPLCGFVRANFTVCDEDQPCEMHSSAQWSVCVGCGGQATRACPVEMTIGSCRHALCPTCLHHEDDTHGPVQDADVTGVRVRSQFAEMRTDLEAVLGRVLAEQAQQGRLSLPGTEALTQVSQELLQGLGLHLIVLHVSALAREAQAREAQAKP